MPSRFLKESICSSADIDGLSADAERFFYRLLVNCDDYGRFDARPAVLASRCFPLKRTLKVEKVASLLNELIEAGLIVVFMHEDMPYLHMPKFAKHQGTPRAKESRYPEPTQAFVSDCTQMFSDASRCHRIRSSVSVVRSSDSYSLARPSEMADFDNFWTTYPRKIGKTAAKKAWAKRIAAGADPQELIASASRFAEWVIAGGTEAKFIPHPTTWLNQGRDEDELPEPASLQSVEPKGFASLRKIREATGGEG